MHRARAQSPRPSAWASPWLPSIQVGSANILGAILGALDGTAVVLALPVLAAYLAVRVAGNVYAHAVACGTCCWSSSRGSLIWLSSSSLLC